MLINYANRTVSNYKHNSLISTHFFIWTLFYVNNMTCILPILNVDLKENKNKILLITFHEECQMISHMIQWDLLTLTTIVVQKIEWKRTNMPAAAYSAYKSMVERSSLGTRVTTLCQIHTNPMNIKADNTYWS